MRNHVRTAAFYSRRSGAHLGGKGVLPKDRVKELQEENLKSYFLQGLPEADGGDQGLPEADGEGSGGYGPMIPDTVISKYGWKLFELKWLEYCSGLNFLIAGAPKTNYGHREYLTKNTAYNGHHRRKKRDKKRDGSAASSQSTNKWIKYNNNTATRVPRPPLPY